MPESAAHKFELSEPLEGFLVVGRMGWVWWHQPQGLDVRLRLTSQSSGAWSVATVVVEAIPRGLFGDASVSARDLRDLPLGRIEPFLNTGQAVAALEDSYAHPERLPDLSPCGLSYEEAVRVSKTLETESISRRRLKIASGGRSQGRGRSDEFYADVLETYLRSAQVRSDAAQAMAEANGVPVTTVHRWLKEARRRARLTIEAKERP